VAGGSICGRSIRRLRCCPAWSRPGSSDCSIPSSPRGSATARDRIEGWAAKVRAEGVEVETHIRAGHPDVEIGKYADDTEADLLVIGTHGRTGLAHLLIGSVAEKVVRTSKVPVLVVRVRQS